MPDDACLEEGILIQEGVVVAELTRVSLADAAGHDRSRDGVERWMAEMLQPCNAGPCTSGIAILETVTYRWRVTLDEIDVDFAERPLLSGRVLANLGLASTVLMAPPPSS